MSLLSIISVVVKPYQPRTHRLDRHIYQEANRITFITICAVAPKLPFVRADLNQALIDLLAAEQARLH